MAKKARRTPKAFVFLLLFFPLAAAWLVAHDSGYFLLPDEIFSSYFPASEAYMIPEEEIVSGILQRAQSYEEKKNYRQAVRYYGYAYTRARDSKAAPFIRFKQASLTERSSESIDMLLEILDRYPDFPHADAARFDLARLHYMRGEYTESLESLRKIIESEASGPPVFTPYVYTFTGILHQKEGRYEEAQRVHNEAIGLLASVDDDKKSSSIVANYLEISRCLLAQYEWDRAEDLLRRIIGTAKKPLVRQEAYILLAESYSGSDKRTRAHMTYQELIDKFPGSVFVPKAKKHLLELGQGDGKDPAGPVQELGYHDPAILDGRYSYGTVTEAAPSQGRFSIQIGSFSISENAQNLIAILEDRGYGAFILETDLEEKRLFRVRVGGYDTIEDAQEAKQKLESLGYSGFIVEEQ